MPASLRPALTNPLNVGMLLLSIAAGLLAAWWLFPLGLALWVVMVILFARDPSVRMRQTLAGRTPLAHRFQTYFDRIERTQINIFNTLSNSRSRVRQSLQPVRQAVDALVNEAYQLGQWMTVLENHRQVSRANDDFTTSIAELEAKIAQSGDALARSEYEESLRTLQARLSNLEALESQIERMEAQLANVTVEMAQILTEVIRLQALEPKQVKQYVPVLVNMMEEQSAQLKAFQQEVGSIPSMMWDGKAG